MPESLARPPIGLKTLEAMTASCRLPFSTLPSIVSETPPT